MNDLEQEMQMRAPVRYEQQDFPEQSQEMIEGDTPVQKFI